MPAHEVPKNCLEWGPLTDAGLVLVFVAFMAIAWANSVELIITTLIKFKRRRSCYFWSLIVASIGVLTFSVSLFLMIFTQYNIHWVLAFINIGRALMIGGHSLVLWSRLHLIYHNAKKLKWFLYGIIIVTISMNLGNVVIAYLAIKGNAIDHNNRAFKIVQPVEISVFSIQEILISSIYLKVTFRVLRTGQVLRPNARKGNTTRVMITQVCAQFFIIGLDLILFFLEIFAPFGVWTSFKGVAYSIKLKVEFFILNQLRRHIVGSSTDYNFLDAAVSNQAKSGSQTGHKSRSEFMSPTRSHNSGILKSVEVSISPYANFPSQSKKGSNNPGSSEIELVKFDA